MLISCELIYFIIGIILTIIWWKKEYKSQYEEAMMSDDGSESSMLCLTLLMSIFLWPIKLCGLIADYLFK